MISHKLIGKDIILHNLPWETYSFAALPRISITIRARKKSNGWTDLFFGAVIIFTPYICLRVEDEPEEY